MGKKDVKDKERSTTATTGSRNKPLSVASAAAEKADAAPVSIPMPKEKRRWSFRRTSAASLPSKDSNPATAAQLGSKAEKEQRMHAMAVAVATAAAADAAVAAAQAAAVVISLTGAPSARGYESAEEAAAARIQAVFRGYLARRALCALKGLVKLQALVRGHLVRRQAAETMRCMQALVTAQARARDQRARKAEEGRPHRRYTPESRTRLPYHETDGGMEEDIKIVEMDIGERRNRSGYSNYPQPDWADHRLSAQCVTPLPTPYKHHNSYFQASPAPSALTDISQIYYSNQLGDYITTPQRSSHCYSVASKPDGHSHIPFYLPGPDYSGPMAYDYPLFPNYMSNTQSSRAKARSQSAPKQRPVDLNFERPPMIRRRPSVEGRTMPRGVRMQRSSSQTGFASQNYQYPWSMKLDSSVASLKDSECGSTSTVLTNATYCRTLVGFDPHGDNRL